MEENTLRGRDVGHRRHQDRVYRITAIYCGSVGCRESFLDEGRPCRRQPLIHFVKLSSNLSNMCGYLFCFVLFLFCVFADTYGTPTRSDWFP